MAATGDGLLKKNAYRQSKAGAHTNSTETEAEYTRPAQSLYRQNSSTNRRGRTKYLLYIRSHRQLLDTGKKEGKIF